MYSSKAKKWIGIGRTCLQGKHRVFELVWSTYVGCIARQCGWPLAKEHGQA
jgi:hypothetical protein